jgi:hypothetical protein
MYCDVSYRAGDCDILNCVMRTCDCDIIFYRASCDFMQTCDYAVTSGCVHGQTLVGVSFIVCSRTDTSGCVFYCVFYYYCALNDL